MGVVKTLDLIPEGIHLLQTVLADLRQGGEVVDQPAGLEDGDLQLLGGEVIDLLFLPGGVGVKDHQGAAVVHGLVVDGEVVGDGLAGVIAEEAVELLVVGGGDLGHVLADLDLGGDIAALVLHGHQLVHAAEHRLCGR